ncbi:IucA/IucC family siderophore biosynthesis protein [Cyanobacteria bacterium FACHB-DQ100]|nr:IucA/IucC family siderophore biosynthesis protein [Cyanobacteria bacterium FACHB-DQ100]
MTENTLIKPATRSLTRTDKQVAEQVTIQSFLNCYLREIGTCKAIEMVDLSCSKLDAVLLETFSREGARSLIRIPLKHQCVDLLIGLRYWSPTGRHLFCFPVYSQTLDGSKLELDYVTLVALIAKELALMNGSHDHQAELMMRVIQSCSNIEQFVQERRQQAEMLYAFRSAFIDTEQALIFGHHLHPTPKSRQGFSEEELFLYSPELQGHFPLHYFRVHRSIVQEGSALSQTATALIKQELLSDASIKDEFKTAYCQEDEYALLPVHPWQAIFLKQQLAVQDLLRTGLLQDLGSQGRNYQPTSSIRTVYHPETAFMLKLSLNIKITNSVRTNLYKELERSIEVHQLLSGVIGQELRDRCSNFTIIRDPAYITLKIDDQPVDGFATILRENPFPASSEADATCLIALCQDSISGEGSRLSEIIHQLAQREGRSTDAVSLDWFRRYLKISLEPILWLYFTHGIGIEAHQQNSVLQLQDGYPHHFFYRDNQGYYYRKSFHSHLNQLLPGISEKSQTICDDAVIDERLGYYLFINNLFGLINAFGVARLVDERSLLSELRNELIKQSTADQGCSTLLQTLLCQKQLRCKANLLTRFHNLDELVGPVSTQSVYVEIDNPLYSDESYAI